MSIEVLENPIELFKRWHTEAREATIEEPDAFCLSTCGADGMPSSRMLLLKGTDDQGFRFYTNLGSRKAQALAENPKAAMCFHWQPLTKQVRIQGTVTPLSPAQADAYFASRPRGSQLGAWASKQSQPLEDRFALEKRVAQYTLKFHIGDVPRPEFWSGFLLKPTVIEFWQAATFRLHERLEYRRDGNDGFWRTQAIYP